MLKVPAKEISRSIQQNEQDKIIDNIMKVPRSTPTRFTLELDGNTILQPDEQVRLHPRSGSRTMNGSRIKVGILGDLQPGLNSTFFFEFFLLRWSFSLARNFNSLAIDGERCTENTFSQCMYRCARCVSTSHCTHSLYHIRGSRLAGLCKIVFVHFISLLRDVSCPAQYIFRSVLYISHYHWSPKVDHIQKTLR